MLYNNHICKVQSQHFPLMEGEYLKKAIGKIPCCLLMTLREMFNANQDMCYQYAREAYTLFYPSGVCTEDDWQLRYEQLATYGVMLSNLVMGYDISSGGMSIYTSSMSLLLSLANKGILKSKKQPIPIELELLKKQLYASDRIKKSIRDSSGKIVCVRLDSEIRNGKMCLTFTLPRTAPTLSSHLFIPFTAYQKAVEVLRQEMQMHILRIRMGDKVRDVTLNEGVLTSLYGEERTKNLVSYLPDIYTQRFYVPSVGASKYTVGVTNIRLTEVDEIKPVSLADIDMSEVNLNYDMVYDFYQKRVLEADDDTLGDIAETVSMDCKNVERSLLVERLLNVTETMYPKDLWEVMKTYNSIYHTEEYSSMQPKYGNKYTPIPIPRTVEELRYLLNNGVYKVVLTKRNGSFSTVICTNNDLIIEKCLGRRFMTYESEGVRLRALKRQMLKNKNIDLDKAIRYYNLESVVGGTYSEVLRQMDIGLRAVEESRTVVNQPTLVTVRNLSASSKETYYRNIDLKSVVEVIQLS